MAFDARAGDTSGNWWKAHGKTLLLLIAIFAVALFIRSYFNFDASWNDGEYRWSGTDGYYHTRVIDHLVQTGEFLLRDGLINYPVGATNPRPPFFVWTIAAIGGLLAKVGVAGGDPVLASALVSAFAPAVWGAATVFPLYFLGKEAFGRAAGLWAAVLLAITASHIQRSNFGAVDHDSAILFFFVLGAFYFVKALKLYRPQTYIEDYRQTGTIGEGFRRVFRDNHAALVYAALTGAAFGGIALIWKGYPYAFAVFAVWYGFQLLANHLRRVDSTGYFVLAMIPVLVTLVMIWPYYAAVGRIDSAVMPTVYILVGMLGASLIFVPTRHLPPVLVLPATVGGFIIGLLLLVVVFPQIGDLFFTGLGYFVQTKLYSTIAEAQRTQLGYLVFSIGIVPFFFALAGIFFALASFVKKKRDDHLFVLVWAAVGLFMAFTATRFVFNATVAFAVLAGWLIHRFITWIRFGEVARTWRSVRSAGTGVAKSTQQAVRFRHVVAVVFLAFILLLPNAWLAVDAGMPGAYIGQQIDEGGDADFWQRWFGAFGQDFLSTSWANTMDYLAAQDTELPEEERPAFIAWWDYGFYAAQRGDHPTVADPFQFGFQMSGRVIASQSEQEAILFQALRLLEGQSVHGGFTAETRSMLDGIEDGLADDLQPMVRRGDYDAAYERVEIALGDDGQAPSDADVTAFYRDVRETTGSSIRYFALEGRMFPCDDPRTNGVDAQSIFYAPVFLADKNPDDFVQTTYRDGQDALYKLKVYETTEDGGSRQIDDPYVEDTLGNKFIVAGGRLFPMAADGSIDYQSSRAAEGIPIANEEYTYYDQFYNTFLYRAWVGEPPADPADKLPQPDGWKPGEGLAHYRLVYSTVAVVPDFTQTNMCGRGGYTGGVSLFKYYEGAEVTGTVTDERGRPIEGAKVVVQDNFGIGHDRVETDASGAFRVLAPFSTDLTEVSPLAEEGADRPDLYRGTGPNRLVVEIGGVEVASQEFSVTDAQSMGEEPFTETFELTVAPGDITGTVFRDVDGDGVFNATRDQAIAGAEVTIENRTMTTGEDGTYGFTDLLPGGYEARVTADGYNPNIIEVQVRSGATTDQDLVIQPQPVTVTGFVTTEDGDPVEGLQVRFERVDAEGTTGSRPSGPDGNYTASVAPGTWNATVEFQTTEDGETVRYFTSEPVGFEANVGDGTITVDITVQREVVES